MTRITIDLDPKTHSILNRWISQAAISVGPPYLEAGEVIAAMIVTTARYTDVGDTVCSQVRQQRTAGQERGRG
jgi:hypothetical protein